jgi:hypothetical protein
MAKESGKHAVFATLGYRSSSPLGYCCPCKETRSERHAWAPLDYSMLELAVTGTTAKIPSPLPIDDQLKAIWERLTTKLFNKVRGHLKKKG